MLVRKDKSYYIQKHSFYYKNSDSQMFLFIIVTLLNVNFQILVITISFY